MIDHEDSFVHTLANYVAQCGAEVSTVRAGLTIEEVESYAPDMVLMSPGPGCPDDFGAPAMIGALAERGIPVFGVCLGLQSIVQHFGGKLDILPTPVHGKPHAVRVNKSVKSYVSQPLRSTSGPSSYYCHASRAGIFWKVCLKNLLQRGITPFMPRSKHFQSASRWSQKRPRR